MGNSVLIALGCLSGVDQHYWPLAFGQLQALDCLYLMTNTSSLPSAGACIDLLSAATADNIRSIESAIAFFTVTYLSPNHIFMLYILFACTLNLKTNDILHVHLLFFHISCQSKEVIRNIVILTLFFFPINYLNVLYFLWFLVSLTSPPFSCFIYHMLTPRLTRWLHLSHCTVLLLLCRCTVVIHVTALATLDFFIVGAQHTVIAYKLSVWQ